MRTLAGLGVIMLAIALVTGCDTDQPLQLEGQTADLIFTATGARLSQFLVFEIFEDSDGVDGPDDVDGDGAPDKSLWCQLTTNDFPANSVPWSFSVEVELLHQGEVVKETVVSSLSPNVNLGLYDNSESLDFTFKSPIPLAHPRGRCSENLAIKCNPDSSVDVCDREDAGFCRREGECDGGSAPTCVITPQGPGVVQCLEPGAGCDCADPQINGGVCQADMTCSDFPGVFCEPNCSDMGAGTTCNAVDETRIFEFGINQSPGIPARRLSAANREVMQATSNFLSDIDPASWSNTICPGQDLGDPGIRDPQTGTKQSPFSFPIQKGDTVIVSARRFNVIPSGLTFTTQPGITASFLVDGQDVAVEGDTSATPGPDSSIFFSFTSR